MGGIIKGQFRIDGPQEQVGFRCSAEQEVKQNCLYVLDGPDPGQKDRVGCGLLRQFVTTNASCPTGVPKIFTPCSAAGTVVSPLQTVAVGSTFLAATCNVAHASGSSPPLFQTFVFPK